MIRTIGLLIIAFSFMISCKQKTGRVKFVEFMNDTSNNILQKQTANGVEIIAKYLPVEFQKNIPGENESQSRTDNSENISLTVKINKAGFKKDKATSLYLNFDIQNDFQLHVDHKFLVPAICQKIENGIQDNYEYIIVFETAALENSLIKEAELIYSDKIFGIGQRKFIFKKNDILKLPRLTTN